jgi:hypothetical protein
MIILQDSDNLVLISTSDVELHVYISYVDLLNKNVTPGRYSNIFNTTVNANVLSAAQGYRTIKTISIKNKGDDSTDITLKCNSVELYNINLGPGGVLQYNSETGFSYESNLLLENFPFAGNIIPTCLTSPGEVIYELQRAGNLAPSPSNIGTTVARCSLFKPYKSISIATIRYYGIATLNNVYRVAIYRYSDLVRISDQLSLNIAANSWGSISSVFTLEAGVLYFAAISVSTTGITAALASLGTSVSDSTGRINSSPSGLPTNLLNYTNSFNFQFSTTSGALPITAPALSAQSAWTGGMPVFFLDSI